MLVCHAIKSLLRPRHRNRKMSLPLPPNGYSLHSDAASDAKRSIEAILNSKPHPVISLLLTGGGMQAIPWFLGVPGASKCIMSAEVPYSRASSEKVVLDYTGIADKTGCSREHAIQLAKAAYQKCNEAMLSDQCSGLHTYVENISKIVGVGCTAALASSDPKKGDHRCHVAVYSNTHCDTYSLILTKGARDRITEDTVCSQLVVDAVTQHLGLPLPVNSVLHHAILAVNTTHANAAPEIIVSTRSDHLNPLESIYQRKAKHTIQFRRHETHHSPRHLHLEDVRVPAGSIVYPGSFNPLHEGHLSLVKASLEQLRIDHAKNRPREMFEPPLVIFEIGAINADKPPLPRDEIDRRLSQFDRKSNHLFEQFGLVNFAVSITSEPLFVEKSAIFRNCRFLVGADTMVRLVNSKYYIDEEGDGDQMPRGSLTLAHQRSITNMASALTTIVENGCSFIVGGRAKTTPSGETVFETCDKIMRASYGEITGAIPKASNEISPHLSCSVDQILPRKVANMFRSLPEEQFRLDLSSTEIRNRAKSK